jgi:hypothetical protein
MLTYGTDPEFFCFKEDQLITADKLFPGKHNPCKLDDNQSVFFDGVQGELNINPATSAAELTSNILAAIEATKNKFDVEEMAFIPTVEVNLKELEDADPECNRFGCDPDYDAYTASMNESDIDAAKHPYRYAGGHFHVGGLPEEIVNSSRNILTFVKMMDVYVGIPSVLHDHSEETVIRRSYKYGKAGSFRVQEHGIEYRALSNYWVGNRELTEEIVDGVNKAVQATLDGTAEKILDAFGEDEIQDIINTVNVDKAIAFIGAINEGL